MKTTQPATTLLFALAATLSFGTLGAQTDAPSEAQTERYPTLQGPRYAVDIVDGYPAVRWDGEPAQERLVVTGATVGYVLDDDGEPKLLLSWGRNFDNADRAYVGESYFRWALSQVKEGKYWDYRKRDAAGRLVRSEADDEAAVPTWTGERVVRLSNPGHEITVTVTRDGATATDNGVPVEVTGSNGNYRLRSADYEAGVSVRADGYVYHYYKPLR